MGNFRIAGLLAGNYAAQVTHPGYALAATAMATVTVGTDSSFPGDIVLTIQTSLKVSLVCEKVNPASHTLSASFYDAAGKRIRRSSTKVGQDGVAIFAGAPMDAVTFEISGSIFEKTTQQTCTIKTDMHNDHGTITLVAREMPMRGGGLRETDRENDRPIGKDATAPAPAIRETSKSIG